MNRISSSSRTISDEDTHITCKICGRVIPVIQGYEPWCECGWNLNLTHRHVSTGLLDRIYRRIGSRRGKAIFENLLKTKKIPRDVGLTTGILLLFSAVVQLIAILFLAFGVYFMIESYSNLFLIFPGLGLLGLAWIARPRFGKLPATALPKAKYPELYRIVNSVAQILNTSAPDYIVINEEFNASVTYSGFLPRKILFIGLPLFLILNGQEKIALISHELAHFVNRDPLRSFFLSLTAKTLVQWHRTLYPDQFLPKGRRGGLILLLSEFASNILFYAIAWIPYIFLQIFVHLAWNRGQAAEYLADRLGAKVSGTEAFIQMCEKTLLKPMIFSVVQSVALKDKASGVIDEIQAEAQNLHSREFDRIKRQAELEEIRLNATHPPTALRIKLLRAGELLNPMLTLSEENEHILKDELSSLINSVNRKLKEKYLRNIYY